MRFTNKMDCMKYPSVIILCNMILPVHVMCEEGVKIFKIRSSKISFLKKPTCFL